MHSERQQPDLESAGRSSDADQAVNYEQEVMKGQRNLQDKDEMPSCTAAAESIHLQGAHVVEKRERMAQDRLFGLLKRVSTFATPTALAVLALVAYSYVVGHRHPIVVIVALTMTFAVSLSLVLCNIFREDLFTSEKEPLALQGYLIKSSILLLFLLMAVCFILFFIS